MKSQSATSNGGLYVTTIWIMVTLATLKLLGILNLSWWLITLPIWLSLLLAGIAIVVLAIVFGFEDDNYGGNHG